MHNSESVIPIISRFTEIKTNFNFYLPENAIKMSQIDSFVYMSAILVGNDFMTSYDVTVTVFTPQKQGKLG